MTTRCTNALSNQISALGEDVTNFLSQFDNWKSLGSHGEYSSRLFGKDGAYSSPTVGGKSNTLRHVHLLPISDPEQLKVWNKRFDKKSRKTSDRALVYVSDETHGHLLIYILAEPDAHRVAQMSTSDDSNLMRKLAAIADTFIHNGSIIG